MGTKKGAYINFNDIELRTVDIGGIIRVINKLSNNKNVSSMINNNIKKNYNQKLKYARSTKAKTNSNSKTN